MKATILLLAAAGVVSSASALEKAIPEPFPQDRYQAMIARSPFGLATAAVAPVVADRSFADGWYISGVAQFDGKDYVSIRSRDLSVQFALYGDARNDNGVKLQNVEWSPTYGRTSATIEKDGQFAKVELLNQTEISGGAAAAGMAPGGIAKPQLPGNSLVRPPGAPSYPQPNIGQPRTAIPRPSGQPIAPPAYQITPGLAPKAAAPPAAPAGAPAAAPGSEGRRRIRVIPSQPTQ